MVTLSGKDAMTGSGGVGDTVSHAVRPCARRWPFLIAAVIIAVLLAGTALLWARHGTAVFFDTLSVGFGACL